MPEPPEKAASPAAPEEDFASLFEESLKTPEAGEIVTGTVVLVGRDYVTVDIGYKCEGQIPISEFRARGADPTVEVGDTGGSN